MKFKEKVMLKAALSHYKEESSLKRFITDSDIQQLPSPQPFDFSKIFFSDAWLGEIHLSWFYPVLVALPKNLHPLLLSVFPATRAQKLSEKLSCSSPTKPLSRFTHLYFVNFLKQKMIPDNVLPRELLFSSQMNELFGLPEKSSEQLLNLLGIYDLAIELRQIVDKALLNKIYAALSEGQLLFLHYASKQPIKWVFSRLELNRWDGTKESLNNMLNQKGLMRFGKGIIDEEYSFRWHFAHRLDKQKGNLLLKTFGEKYDPIMVPYFKKQILHILKRYQ